VSRKEIPLRSKQSSPNARSLDTADVSSGRASATEPALAKVSCVADTSRSAAGLFGVASACSWPDCDIREYAGKPTVAKSALRFSGCFTAPCPKGSPRPSAVIAGTARPRFRAAGSDSIAAICRGVAHICGSSLPHPRASHRPVAHRCGRCRMLGRAASTPRPRQHRITNSISASRGKNKLDEDPISLGGERSCLGLSSGPSAADR